MKSIVVSQKFYRKKYIALPSSIQCMKLSVIQAKIEFKTPEAQMSSKKTGGCREAFSCKIYAFRLNLHSKAISHLNKQTDST